MTSLHSLTGQYLELASNEEIPIEAITDTLEGIHGTIEEKALSLGDWMLDIDGSIDKIEAAIDRLALKKKTLSNRKESLREYLRSNMELVGIKKITCPLFTITYVAGQDIVVIQDEALLPDEFVKVTVSSLPDKVKIKKALKEGQDIQGAYLAEGQSSIRIK